MKNNNTNELTKSQLIDFVLNQNAKIKQLEQRVKNLNKNSLRNLSTNYLEHAKKLGYNWMSLLRKETRQKVIDKVIKFRMSKILKNAKMDSLMSKKKYEQLKKMEDEIKREHKRIMKNEQLKMMEDEIKREHKRIMQKPAPSPKTKIEQKAEAMKGYTNSYEINIINKKDPLEQLINTRKALENHIWTILIQRKV